MQSELKGVSREACMDKSSFVVAHECVGVVQYRSHVTADRFHLQESMHG